MDEQIWLISERYEANSFGELTPKECATPVLASVSSVTRAEWSQASMAGLQPELVATTNRINYSGEKVVEIGGRRYGVYRTYFQGDRDTIELYLQEKIGDGTEPGTREG